MSFTTFPVFIDELLAKIRALPACQAPVVVFDGMQGASSPDLFVSVGGMAEPTEDGTVEWAELGNQAQWEDYEVVCYIWSWVGGDDNAGQGSNGDALSDAQKSARDNAFGLFDPIAAALKQDTNFLAANGGTTPLIQWCNVSKMSVLQTPAAAETDTGARGRSCRIDFKIHVRARITTS